MRKNGQIAQSPLKKVALQSFLQACKVRCQKGKPALNLDDMFKLVTERFGKGSDTAMLWETFLNLHCNPDAPLGGLC